MRSPTLGADRRPRIHLWPLPQGAEFNFGPCGTRVRAGSIGEAVENAVAAVERRAAVFIWEGMEG